MAFKLTIANGLDEGREFTFQKPQATIGRAEDADVALSAVGVSRRHARIFAERGRFFAEDLGSQAGTQVNAARIDAATELQSGDRVSIGPVVLRFEISAQAAAKPGGSGVRQGLPADGKPGAPGTRGAVGRGAKARGGIEDSEESISGSRSSGAARPGASGSRTGPGDGEGSVSGARGSARPGEGEGSYNSARGSGRPNDGEGSSAGSRGSTRPGDGEGSYSGARGSARPNDGEGSSAGSRGGTRPGASGSRPGAPDGEGSVSGTRSRVPARPGASGSRGGVAEARSGAEASVSGVRPGGSGARKPPPGAARPGGTNVAEARWEARDASPDEPGEVITSPVPVSSIMGTQVADAAGKPELGGAALMQAVMRTRKRQDADRQPSKRGGWSQLPARLRWSVLLGLALASVVGAALLLVRDPARGASAEPQQLGPRPIPDSFGFGPGVRWPQPDRKRFLFAYGGERAVGLLHYQAGAVSDGEVAITLNGSSLGTVPRDSTNILERDLELLLPQDELRRNEPNELVFDNLKSPPAEEGWRVWNVYVEWVPLPDLRPEELISGAQDYVEKADGLYEQRGAALENTFLVWKNLRWALIYYQAAGAAEQRAAVAAKLGEVGRQLDQQCGVALLGAQGFLERKQPDKAREALQDVLRHFPTGEHHCHNLAQERLDANGL